jgi:hypothetical protein
MLVMEYIPGGSLFKQMGDEGVPKGKAAHYFEYNCLSSPLIFKSLFL